MKPCASADTTEKCSMNATWTEAAWRKPHDPNGSDVQRQLDPQSAEPDMLNLASPVCECVCAHVWSICLYVRILNRTTGQETGSAFTYSEYRKCWQPPVCVFIKGFIRFSVDICWIFSSVAASMPTSVSRSRLKYLSSFWRCALKSYTNNHKKENFIWFAWKIWPNIFIFFSRFEQDVKNDWTQVDISKSRKR